MKSWPKVALGQLISRADETAVLDPLEQYHEVTIKLWGKGVLSRGKVLGSDVVSVRRVVRANQLILSKIDGFGKIYAASPGTAARNWTMTAPALMAIEVPMPPLISQQTFGRLQVEVAALKAKHTAIRKPSAALLPATLERAFA